MTKPRVSGAPPWVGDAIRSQTPTGFHTCSPLGHLQRYATPLGLGRMVPREPGWRFAYPGLCHATPTGFSCSVVSHRKTRCSTASIASRLHIGIEITGARRRPLEEHRSRWPPSHCTRQIPLLRPVHLIVMRPSRLGGCSPPASVQIAEQVLLQRNGSEMLKSHSPVEF